MTTMARTAPETKRQQPPRQQEKPTTSSRKVVRGISHVSETACHLNAALVCLAHALDPVCEALIAVATTAASLKTEGSITSSSLCLELGKFLQEWTAAATTTTKNVGSLDHHHQQQQNQQQQEKKQPIEREREEEAISPIQIYHALYQFCNLQAHELGDAVTALMKILFVAQEEKIIPEQFWTAAISGGRIYSILTGTASAISNCHCPGDEKDSCYNNEEVVVTKKRIKRTNSRPMACPLSVPILTTIDETTAAARKQYRLEDALQAVRQPKPVQGYQWRGTVGTDYIEHEISTSKISDRNKDNETNEITTRQQRWEQLPSLLMLHLQRHNSSGIAPTTSFAAGIETKGSHIVIPAVLDLTTESSSLLGSKDTDGSEKKTSKQEESKQYELTGGILHVHDNTSSDECDEFNHGHYVAIIRGYGHGVCSFNNTEKGWFLVDDSDTYVLSESRALQLLGGCYAESFCEEHHQRQYREEKNKENPPHYLMQGVLLFYCQSTADNNIELLFDKMIIDEALRRNCQKHGSASDEDGAASHHDRNGNSYIGRRLQVRWAGNKWYAGTVTAYNHETSKHEVTYDDGDIRWYSLAKKVIRWLSDSDKIQ